eukprot:c18415_g2_i2 orf=155-1144(-)
MGCEEENTYFHNWLGRGREPLMRGLHLAGKLQAELNGPNLKANKPYSPRELLARLSDIVRTFNDGINQLSCLLLLEENAPLKQPSKYNLGKASNVKDLGAQQGAQNYIRKKLRKSLPKYTLRVQGDTKCFDDHYIWRKYGQKYTLGKKHPRSYFKCFHQRDLNCPALKQVQQCDGNNSEFNVTYIGEHTCEETCDEHHTKNNITSPVISHLQSNSYTSLPSTPELNTSPMEPSLITHGNIESYEEEMEEEVQSSGFPPASMDGLYSILEHDVLPPDQVSNSIKVITDSINFSQAIEQYEESNIMFNFSPIWDVELNDQFLSFKDFEGQL